MRIRPLIWLGLVSIGLVKIRERFFFRGIMCKFKGTKQIEEPYETTHF